MHIYIYIYVSRQNKIGTLCTKKKEHNLYNNDICEEGGLPMIECHVNYYNIN